jgi:hypothetical protein
MVSRNMGMAQPFEAPWITKLLSCICGPAIRIRTVFTQTERATPQGENSLGMWKLSTVLEKKMIYIYICNMNII